MGHVQEHSYVRLPGGYVCGRRCHRFYVAGKSPSPPGRVSTIGKLHRTSHGEVEIPLPHLVMGRLSCLVSLQIASRDSCFRRWVNWGSQVSHCEQGSQVGICREIWD